MFFNWFKTKGVGFIPNIEIPETDVTTINNQIGYKHICATCGEIFMTKGEAKSRRFCSYDCSTKVNNIENRRYSYYRKCAYSQCDNWIITDSKAGKYCSEVCSVRANTRSSADKFSAVDMEYYYEKYNFTCHICLNQFEPGCLFPHHIIPVALGGDTNEDNITLLCEDCHGKQHTREIWSQIRNNKSSAKRILFEQQQEHINTPFYGIAVYRY